MFSSSPQPLHTVESIGVLPGQLLDVVTELTEIVLDENTSLAEGLPAHFGATVERKRELSHTYEDLCAELLDQRRDALAADPELARKLMEAVIRLREATAENLTRLEAAMNASRRRVEAVMAAMRQEVGATSSYGPRGNVPLGARLAAFSQDIHC